MFLIEYWEGNGGWEFAVKRKRSSEWILRSRIFPSRSSCEKNINWLIDEMITPGSVTVQRITALSR